jgi:hypothetical protein
VNRWIAALLAGVAVTLVACGDDSDAPPPLSPSASSGDVAEPLGFPAAATRNTVRVAGANAAEDAAGVANAAFPATSNATKPNAVVLVEENDWQAAVAGAVLAAKPIGAPLLLSGDGELPDVTAETLKRLDPRGSDLSEDAQVIRIGDKPAQPDGFRTARIDGDDQYERAAAIDRFSSAIRGRPSPNVVVVNGERPEFALPAAAWAARSGDSVLMVERDRVPEATRKVLKSRGDTNVYVLGPQSVIAPETADQLRGYGSYRRIGGDDPVSNAVEFARTEFGDFGWGATVPGYNFTLANLSRPLDAAAAATLATRGVFAPLLLTNSAEKLPETLEGYLLSVQPGYEDDPGQAVYNRMWILGGEDEVSIEEQAQVDTLTELIPVQANAP